MSIEPTIYSSANDFISAISLINPSWWNTKHECHWIFRGQAASQLLMPSLYREFRDSTTTTTYYQATIKSILADLQLDNAADTNTMTENRIRNSSIFHNGDICDDKVPHLTEIIKASYIEVHLIEQFIIRCNKIRLQTPSLKLFDNQNPSLSATQDFHHNIDQLMKFFSLHYNNKKHAENLLYSQRFINFSTPESLALSRHHGVPSRLLDWTAEPLIAAFFSAANNQDDDICIWALNRAGLNTNIGAGQIEFHDRLSRTGLEFLHQQKGLFTDMIGCEMYQYHNGTWPTLDEYLLKTYINSRLNQPYPQENYLKKIVLKKSERETLLKHLDGMGYNAYSLMPTYDNVGKSILPNQRDQTSI